MTSNRSDSSETTAPSGRRLSFRGLEQRLIAEVRETLPPGARFVVGFSGGSDSLALAAALARVRPVAGVGPVLVHVDHNLRPESRAEAEHAVELGNALGLPVDVVTLEPGLAQRHPGTGVEEAARRERYLALASRASELGIDVVALAHHESDQAETLLLHLLRGSGVTGAAAMARRRGVTVPWWPDALDQPIRVTLWRPLLSESKHEIDGYVATLGLTPNLDSSNDDASFARNEIRHELLPVIDRIRPSGRKALARYAGIAADDDIALDVWTARVAKEVIEDGAIRKGETWVSLPIAIRRRLIRSWLAGRHPGLEVPANRVEAAVQLLASGDERAELEIGGDIRVALIGDALQSGTHDELDAVAWARFGGLRSPDAGVVERAEQSVVQEPTAGAEPWIRLPVRLVQDGWSVRVVQPSDRFVEHGRRVDQWLRVHGVPVRIRGSVTVVCVDEGVIWVPGLPVPKELEVESGGDSVVLRWVNEETDVREAH